MSVSVCVSVKGPNADFYREVFGKRLPEQIKSITYGSTPAEFEAIKKSGDKILLLVDGPISHDIMKDLCDDYELPKEKRRVQLIYSITAGVDAFRLGELVKELTGIPFMNASGCYSPILAEHVIYSMLYFNRQTWRLQSNRAATNWEQYNMLELRGQKLGIVGYGDIGHAIARLAKAFGMDVTGVKRSKPTADVDEQGVKLVHGEAECDRVLRESDFVVGVLPGTEETKQYFKKDRFAMMKPTAVFINIGRGITQCETDLIEALRNGVIAGAALDVFEKEPLPKDSGLWTLGDNKVLLSYHTADRSANFLGTSVNRFLTLVDEHLAKGQASGYCVDFRKGY